jgi:hypothetical protein
MLEGVLCELKIVFIIEIENYLHNNYGECIECVVLCIFDCVRK